MFRYSPPKILWPLAIASLLFLFTLNLWPAQAAPPELIIYVQATADDGGDGLSWDTAFNDLQEALQFAESDASPGDEIWVATGVYTPGNSINDTFTLLPGIALYGGFEGTEAEDELELRDWENNPTVLSGDIDNNDLTDADGVITDTLGIVGANSLHIVTGSGVTETAVLDGFIITGGSATDNFFACPDSCGGGVYNDNGQPTLANLTFTGNEANSFGGAIYNNDSAPILNNIAFNNNAVNDSGGALFNNNSAPTLTDVTFDSNSAASEGGAVYNNGGGSTPIFTGATFQANTAESGGALYNLFSTPVLSDVVFSDNVSNSFGGAIANNNSAPEITNAVFDNNRTSGLGGAINNFVNSNTVLDNATFTNNFANFAGGAMSNSGSAPVLTNVAFQGNAVVDQGGAMYSSASSNPILINVVFSGNMADVIGGAIYTTDSSNPTLINVTVHGNLTAGVGGGLVNLNNSNIVLTNTIVWGNRDITGVGTPSTSFFNNESVPIISHSLIQGSGGSGNDWNADFGDDQGNNLDRDPNFIAPISPTDTPTTEGDVRLRTGSPAIDVGDTDSYLDATDVLLDLAGNPRLVDGDSNTEAIIDLGAYEAPIPEESRIFVPLIIN